MASTLQFHNTHGKNVRLLADRSMARRVSSFYEGIAFSQQTIRPNEKVCLRVAEVSTSFSGNLRIGFTSCDPDSFSRTLPKSFFSGLTSRPGFWGKQLPECYVGVGVLLAFHYTTSGYVMLNVDGQDKGVFFEGVDAQTPLWFIVDIFSNTIAVQFVGIADPTARMVAQQLTFHPHIHGANIRIIGSRTAIRLDGKNCNGCVFSSRPINPEESWVVQIVQTNSKHNGVMGFGFTSCNPASLSSTDLPDNADDLHDRPEYWVILRNRIFKDELIHRIEIEFHLSHNGKVTMKKRNGDAKTDFMHVDVSLPLWAIFDVYGSTQAIRLLSASTICPPQPVESFAASIHEASAQTSLLRSQPIQHQPIDKITTSATQITLQQPVLSFETVSCVETHSPSQSAGETGSNRECTVCYGRSVDCVLSPCGHFSFCYDCARKIFHDGRTGGGQGLCPICRVPIREVIRVYES